MEFEQCRLYRAIVECPFHKVGAKILELTEQGRDVRIRDSSGSTFLHLAAKYADKFHHSRALSAIYALCLAGVDINAQDINGDTALHVLVRQQRVWKIVIALLRYRKYFWIILLKI